MDFHALITTFLSDLADPAAGERVYDRFSRNARVYCQFEARPISEVPRDRFAQLFYAVDALHQAEHPDTPRKPVILEPQQIRIDHEGDDRVVGWFSAREIHDDRPVTVAVGFCREDDDWKIEWLTLADRPQEWLYGVGLAQTLADAVYGGVSLTVMPRSWLDLAYYRMYDAPKPPLVMLPEAKFSCGMSGVCCHVDWAIDVTPDAQMLVDAIPWAQLGRPDLEGTVLEPTDNGKLTLKGPGMSCRFLDEHRHCQIHKHLGRAAFVPCAVFPFVFAATPDGVSVAASPLCGSVRNNFGTPLPERTEDIYGRLTMLAASTDPGPLSYHLTLDQEVTWEAFREAEQTVLAWLDRADLPMRRRLWVASRYLSALAANEPLQWDDWAEEPADEVPERHRANATTMLDRFEELMGVNRARDLHGVGSGPVDIEPVMQNVMRNVLFSKLYSFDHGLVVGFNVAVLYFLALERLRAEYAPNPVPESRVVELSKRLMHGFLAAGLERQSSDAYRELLKLLDQPEAGTWFLSCLQDQTALPAS